MPSHENSQNNTNINQKYSHDLNGEENVSRPSNPVTESRVLRILLQHDNNLDLESQPDRATADSSNPSSSGNQSSQATSSTDSQELLTLPQVRSVLSADAKEFVPISKAAFIQNSYSGQKHNQGDTFSLSVTAAEFVPQISESYTSYNAPYYTNTSYENYEQNPNYLLEDFNSISMLDQFDASYTYRAPSEGVTILDRFNQALHVLNMHPGNMEEYLRPVCGMICNSYHTTEIVNDVAESLYNQSIQEPNFRYTGARICQFLNINLKGNPHFSGFTKIFINRCLKEYNTRDDLKNGSLEDQEKLRGLAMFMAEIFLNVETEAPDGTIQHLHFLPTILVDFIHTILSVPSDLDVKCSCQLLKLSGGLIEDVVKNSPDECLKFEEIFSQLQTLQSSTKLTENTKFLIGTVIKLKECDWNRSSSSPSKKSVSLFPLESSNFQTPEPVFYNQMGAPCSRTESDFPEEDPEEEAYILNEEEEAAFITWQEEQTESEGTLINNDTGYDSYNLDETIDEGGMGDEMEAAYEEFLQKQNYLQGYQSQGAGPSNQLTHTSGHPIFYHSPHQEFNDYQQEQMLPYNHQQDQRQQQHLDQQQQYPTQYTNPDPYHYRRL